MADSHVHRKPVPQPQIQSQAQPTASPVTAPYVRPYYPGDFDDVINVFRVTADKAIQSEPALTIGSYIWCRPYTYFYNSEAVCFVLDNGSGQAVGYIIGTPDTASYVRAYRESYLPSLEGEEGMGLGGKGGVVGSLSWMVLNPDYMEFKRFPGLLQNFPAHFHIDILPQYQRKGYGAKMVHTFCDTLRNMNVIGVHLGVVTDNEAGKRFYRRMGFEPFPDVMDGGKSGLPGRTLDNSDYMVGKL